MCTKLGSNKFNTVKGLMNMSLNAIISEIFHIDLDDIDPTLVLRTQMKMDQAKQQELEDTLAEYFDGLQVDFNQIKTVDDLFERVVETEFKDIPDGVFVI